MRRTRLAAVTASIGLGLVFAGAGSPAQAAATMPTGQPGTVQSGYRFGMYYYEWACHYYGNSLVQGGAFSSYQCVLEYYPPDNAYYWVLYVY